MREPIATQAVKPGQVYRCKRRGHEVKVLSVEQETDTAYFKNKRGESRQIWTKRLLQKSRFTLVSETGSLAPKPEPFPAESTAA